MSRNSVRHRLVTLLGGALIAAVTICGAAPAQATSPFTRDRADAAAMAWLARPEILSGYAGDGTFQSYAGPTAKLALAVQVRGGDPTSFGGVDLINRLRGLQQPSGRFSDRSPFGDFSNIFTQSFALLALDRTAAGAPATAGSATSPGWQTPAVRGLPDRRCAPGAASSPRSRQGRS